MATTDKLPSRLHHNAYVSKDLEATRAFYEDLSGLPLVAALAVLIGSLLVPVVYSFAHYKSLERRGAL